MKKIVLIGSGNVATHLGMALVKNGIEVVQVWSRTIEHAELLAQQIGCEGINDMQMLCADADTYIFSVKDDVLPKLLSDFPYKGKILIHTAGSVGVDILKPYSNRYGVFYPLQTFSKTQQVDFNVIPLLLEASDSELMTELKFMAEKLSSKVIEGTSEQRKKLHIAAVFACNFTNHLYAIAEEILEKNGLEFDCVRPLILETAQKAMLHSPKTIQTGPAARKDVQIINSHLDMLSDDPELQELYKLISERIVGHYHY